MRHPRLAALGVAATTILGVSAGTGTAHADPAKGFPVHITCGSTTFHAVVNGNGAWTPAHDTGSTTMLIPMAFGETTIAVTYPDGTSETFTEPGDTKAAATKNPNATTECTYTSSFTDPDGTTGTISGSVVGIITPAS